MFHVARRRLLFGMVIAAVMLAAYAVRWLVTG
jgi:hypothetical protein